MAYIQRNNPFPVTSCGRRRSFMNNNVRRQINSPGKDRTEESPFNKRVDKESMPCNKPRASTKSNKKKSFWRKTNVFFKPEDRLACQVLALNLLSEKVFGESLKYFYFSLLILFCKIITSL